jgi:hypothetical protein
VDFSPRTDAPMMRLESAATVDFSPRTDTPVMHFDSAVFDAATIVIQNLPRTVPSHPPKDLQMSDRFATSRWAEAIVLQI